jgi:hypothetical protein
VRFDGTLRLEPVEVLNGELVSYETRKFVDAVNILTLRCANSLLTLRPRTGSLLLLVLGNLLALSFRTRSLLLLVIGNLLALSFRTRSLLLLVITAFKLELDFKEGMIRVNRCYQGLDAMVEIGSCVGIVQYVWIAMRPDCT